MSRTKLLLLAAPVALICACTGCGGTYRAETVLHSDGSLDRTVYQPAGETPEPVKQARVWKQITFAPKPEDLDKQGWPDALAMLPAHAQDEQHPYFAAWNLFASVKDLPETVLFKSPEGSGVPNGKLEHELVRTDLGFVEEFRWRETLTDVVTLEGMHKARAELADLMIQLGQDVFAEALGKEYDASDLVQWAKTEGKDWIFELTDLDFAKEAAQDSAARKSLEDELTTNLERHGLKLKVGGEWLKNEATNQILKSFVTNFVGEKVKKNGKTVGRETAQKWLEELNSKDGGRFKPAFEKVIVQKFGGEMVFDKRMGSLVARIVGLYRLSAPFDFRYAMTFPGPVVETNGELVGDGDKVRWSFPSSRAYPFGYSMEARCLFVAEDARKLLRREKPLSDRDSLVTYVDSVRGNDVLGTVMRKCRTERSLDPLNEYLESVKGNASQAALVQKVVKLLKAS
jgi:hypothetical protein